MLISKFLDHIPFYRMESIFLRHKLEITRATLCNWTIGVYERYQHLFSFYKNILLSGRLLGIDETRLQVHKEEGRSDTTDSYMWLIRGQLLEIFSSKFKTLQSRRGNKHFRPISKGDVF
ncbi:MAG: transposase [Leptospiraceae bacterium]|nr:transposase [Leptospiraceae bacterium]